MKTNLDISKALELHQQGFILMQKIFFEGMDYKMQMVIDLFEHIIEDSPSAGLGDFKEIHNMVILSLIGILKKARAEEKKHINKTMSLGDLNSKSNLKVDDFLKGLKNTGGENK